MSSGELQATSRCTSSSSQRGSNFDAARSSHPGRNHPVDGANAKDAPDATEGAEADRSLRGNDRGRRPGCCCSDRSVQSFNPPKRRGVRAEVFHAGVAVQERAGERSVAQRRGPMIADRLVDAARAFRTARVAAVGAAGLDGALGIALVRRRLLARRRQGERVN